MSDQVTKYEADVSAVLPALEMVSRMLQDGLDAEAILQMREAHRHNGTVVVYFWVDIHVKYSTTIYDTREE
jgi:hypothetical protein